MLCSLDWWLVTDTGISVRPIGTIVKRQAVKEKSPPNYQSALRNMPE
jgi:hypothetical protein